jgi:hypothetical protein
VIFLEYPARYVFMGQQGCGWGGGSAPTRLNVAGRGILQGFAQGFQQDM